MESVKRAHGSLKEINEHKDTFAYFLLTTSPDKFLKIEFKKKHSLHTHVQISNERNLLTTKKLPNMPLSELITETN